MGGSSYAISNLVATGAWGNFIPGSSNTLNGVTYYDALSPTATFTFTANGINYSSSVLSGMETLTGGGLTYDAAHPALSTRLVLAQPSYSVGAPEIDGSLAPKVGFLLGCLFLMFGRKKQSTEPMLAVSTI